MLKLNFPCELKLLKKHLMTKEKQNQQHSPLTVCLSETISLGGWGWGRGGGYHSPADVFSPCQSRVRHCLIIVLLVLIQTLLLFFQLNILVDTGSSNFAVAAASHPFITHYFNTALWVEAAVCVTQDKQSPDKRVLLPYLLRLFYRISWWMLAKLKQTNKQTKTRSLFLWSWLNQTNSHSPVCLRLSSGVQRTDEGQKTHHVP